MICPACQRFEGTVAMVFASEAEYRRSPYATGEDGLEHPDFPEATHAVWPGKSNIGRNADELLLAAPAHPRCGHQFEEYSPGQLYEDWFSKITPEEMERYETST